MDRVIEQLAVLSETATRFSSCEQPIDVFERALAAVEALTGGARSSLLLFDPDGVLRFKHWRGLSDAYRAAVEGHTPWSPGQREPEPILVEDVGADESLGRYKVDVEREGIRALGFFPLVPRGGTIGKIMVYWDVPHVCGRGEIELLRTLAGLTAFALDRHRMVAASDELHQRQRVESLGLMAGGVAHDFNNLLVGVMGNAALALATLRPDAPAVRYLDDVSTAARRASELTKQLLAYSGKGSFVIQSCELAGLVAECVRLLGTVLSQRAAVTVEIEPTCVVRADATQLRQIVINLLTNASDALGDSAGKIRVSARQIVVEGGDAPQIAPAGQSLAPGRYCILTIEDTGVGMDAATLGHIFDPFFTTKGQGRGLGLSAILGIVRSHHGAVHVESEPGSGSSFQVYLPVAPSEGLAVELPPQLRETATRAHILVVDDTEMVRRVVQSVLEMENHTAETVASGERALEVLSERPTSWDAIIMDLTMPKMSGLETLALIRKRWVELPVVIMSGFSRTGIPPMEDDPATQFLEKPFTSAQLLDVLATAMGGASSITRR
jgi:signal transduction histidine kinase/ActR/RegA family two-component response regulator